jgi:hypothetical protein
MSCMRGFVTIAIILMSAGGTFAKPAVVRSGEHGHFSRLVITANTLGAWETTSSSNQFKIEFSTFNQGFNVSEVFTRIDRQRLQDIVSQNSTIEFRLACQCDIEIFEATPNMIVLDIKDRKFVAFFPKGDLKYINSRNHLSFASQSIPSNNAPKWSTHYLRYPARRLAITPFIARNSNTGLAQQGPSPEVSENPLTVSGKTLINTLQNRLVGSFGAAATRGILNIDESVASGRLDRPVSSSTSLAPLGTGHEGTANFSIESSLVSPTNRNKTTLKEDFDIRCISSNRFEISKWSDGRPFDQQLGDASPKLFTTLEKLDVAAAIKLARLYLFFGFGAEAKQVLNYDISLQKRWPELVVIADILENKPTQLLSIFSESSDCKGPISLWAVLVNSLESPYILENKNEILFELSSLPIHLRRILAPKVSARFLEARLPSYASSALQTLKRTKYPLSEIAKLENGGILHATNKSAAALDVFSSISSNSQTAIEALIHKTHLQLEANLELDESTQRLIEAYATEYQETSIGVELIEISILALSKAGEFGHAFQKIADLNEEIQGPILRKVYGDIVTLTSDVSFSEHAFTNVKKTVLTYNADLSLQFSRRLLALGFLDEALAIFSALSEPKLSEEAKLLGAEILIALNKPAAAATYLSDLKSAEAALLTAQILILQNNRDGAARVFQNFDKAEKKQLNAWLAPNWKESFKDSDGPVGRLVQIAQSPVSSINQLDGMLGQTQSLINESRQSRSLISSIIRSKELNLN